VAEIKPESTGKMRYFISDLKTMRWFNNNYRFKTGLQNV
jgi:hypothetical protein